MKLVEEIHSLKVRCIAPLPILFIRAPEGGATGPQRRIGPLVLRARCLLYRLNITIFKYQ